MKKATKMTPSTYLPHLPRHLPSKKTVVRTLLEQAPGAIIGIALLGFLGWLIPTTSQPMVPSNGVIAPNVVRPGDKVKVDWSQQWDELCPLKITREFVGSDDFKAPGVTFVVDPPPTRGTHYPTPRDLWIPKLPTGPAYYQSTIEPLCPWDILVHQRKYHSPPIKVLVLPPLEPGPR